MKALRRGWYLGEAGFVDRLLDMIKKPAAGKSRASGAAKAHGEAEAERVAVGALARMKLPTETQELAKLRKGDGRKVLVACLIRQRTAAGNPWIAKRLAMGHSYSLGSGLAFQQNGLTMFLRSPFDEPCQGPCVINIPVRFTT
jgi:hypothetical protein